MKLSKVQKELLSRVCFSYHYLQTIETKIPREKFGEYVCYDGREAKTCMALVRAGCFTFSSNGSYHVTGLGLAWYATDKGGN